jgi:hypothetical protein
MDSDRLQESHVYRWLSRVEPSDVPEGADLPNPSTETHENHRRQEAPNVNFHRAVLGAEQGDQPGLYASSAFRHPVTSGFDRAPDHTPENIYERKPRRKTREDRYEPKEKRPLDGDQLDKRQSGSRKKRSKGKGKPDEAFKPPNVLQQRLTVLGIPSTFSMSRTWLTQPSSS